MALAGKMYQMVNLVNRWRAGFACIRVQGVPSTRLKAALGKVCGHLRQY